MGNIAGRLGFKNDVTAVGQHLMVKRGQARIRVLSPVALALPTDAHPGTNHICKKKTATNFVAVYAYFTRARGRFYL